jgi:hypothetical protein
MEVQKYLFTEVTILRRIVKLISPLVSKFDNFVLLKF